MNIPNLLTTARLIAIPAVVLIYLSNLEYKNTIAGWLFGLTCITDFIDGYLARKWNQSTSFGAFFDPVADKLMVCVALILLVSSYNNDLFVIVPAIIIILREIAVSALREWMAENNLRDKVAVSKTGKAKTLTQMFAISFMLGGSFWVYAGYPLLVVATILTIWSMIEYFSAAAPYLKFNEQ